MFTTEDGLSSNGIWLKALDVPRNAPATIVLDDQGRGHSAVHVADRLNRGEQVLAADLPFMGDSWHQDTAWMFEPTWLLEQNLYAIGERPLGIEVAHLIALANWLKGQGASQIRIETMGIRNQVVALVTSALEPSLLSEIVIRNGMASLRHLIDKPVKYAEAPDLFCLDLYKFTDLDRLAALSAPTTVVYPLPKSQP